MFGLGEIRIVAGRLLQQQGGAGHVGVIVQRRRMGGPPVAPGVVQPAVDDHVLAHEAVGLRPGRYPVRPVQRQACRGQRSDHQRVPVGQHLVVLAGSDPRLAGLEQDGAAAGTPGLRLVLGGRHGAKLVEADMAFPIARRGDVVIIRKQACVLAKQGIDFILAPDIEPAFLALAVSIQ